MKTLICTQPGHFEFTETIFPVRNSGETLLQIKRIGICGTDLHAYEGTQPYFSYPRILGHELAGEIIETDAEGFSKGEQVAIIPYIHCGNCIACKQEKTNCCTSLQVLGVHVDGGMREYIVVPNKLLIKGNGLSLDELALIEPLSIGAHGVRRAQIEANEFVLIIGAGPIGLGVIEFAKIAGARVIVMDVNDNRLNFCQTNLHVEFLINPSKQDAIEVLKSITNQQMASVVIDATGNLQAINKGLQFLAHAGRYVLVGLQKEAFSFSHPEFHKREATLMSSRNATRSDFEWVMDCIQNGKIKPKDFISHIIDFEEVNNQFASFLNPHLNVIKAIVKLDS